VLIKTRSYGPQWHGSRLVSRRKPSLFSM